MCAGAGGSGGEGGGSGCEMSLVAGKSHATGEGKHHFRSLGERWGRGASVYVIIYICVCVMSKCR